MPHPRRSFPDDCADRQRAGVRAWLTKRRNAATTTKQAFDANKAERNRRGVPSEVKQFLFRCLTVIALAASIPAFTGPAALGQGIVKSQHGDWQMSCDTPPGASFEQCAIIQNVTAEDQPNVGLSVIVLKTADQQARLLRVLAPLGVLLPNGLGLNVDGTDLGRVAFVRCLPNGCVAEVIMDDALLETLSEGENAIFVVFRTPEEGIGIPVSLDGFKEGFEALP